MNSTSICVRMLDTCSVLEQELYFCYFILVVVGGFVDSVALIIMSLSDYTFCQQSYACSNISGGHHT
jgi:hypothetical protein